MNILKIKLTIYLDKEYHELLDELPEECKTLNSSHLNDDSPKFDHQGNRGMSYRAQLLLSHLLPFHQREAKVSWWTYFDRKDTVRIF